MSFIYTDIYLNLVYFVRCLFTYALTCFLQRINPVPYESVCEQTHTHTHTNAEKYVYACIKWFWLHRVTFTFTCNINSSQVDGEQQTVADKRIRFNRHTDTHTHTLIHTYSCVYVNDMQMKMHQMSIERRI